MADNVNNVTDSTFQAEVIDASKTQPVMVDFWAEWCRPCLMLAPTVAEIATAYAGKIKVVKLNVDENTDSAGKFNIRGIPTLLIFKGGQVAEQVVGAVQQALAIFRNEPAVWRRIQTSGMSKDFSWQPSAIEYARLYEVAWKSRNRKAVTSSNQAGAKPGRISRAASIGKGSHGR